MRRISQIDKGIRLFRVSDGEELFRYAQIHPGDKIRAKADSHCYNDRGYETELLDDDLQTRIGQPWRLTLDIANGSSKERLDRWEDRSVLSISGKYREDYERHNTQVVAEKERGVIAYGRIPFVCIASIRSQEVDYDTSGYDQVFGGTLTANRRQFFLKGKDGVYEEQVPQPKESLEVNGQDYLVEEVRRDISIVRFRLSRHRGGRVNK